MNIVEFNQVIKSFKQQIILNEVSFSVPQGSVFGFLGNNGAGKSTTVRLMLGLLKPSHGDIKLFNSPAHKVLPQALNKVGCIVDTPALYQHLTAADYLSIPQRLKHLPKSEIDRVLAIVEMSASKNKIIDQFSLGMKQRLAIANGLLGEPELLVLDEPTNGLDPQGMSDTRELLKNLPQKTGCTVFVSSHLLNEVERMVSHVAIINKGEIVLQDSLQNLMTLEGQLSISCSKPSLASRALVSANFECTATQHNELLIKGITQAQCPQVHHLLSKHDVDFWQSRFDQTTLEETFMKACNTQHTIQEVSA